MRLFTVLLLIIILLTGCVCAYPQNDAITYSSDKEESVLSSAGDTAQSKTEDNYSEDTEKFYDYFRENSHIYALLSNESGGESFSDAEMAEYAICELIIKNGGSYEQEIGFPKDDVDAVTMKFFGTTIKDYENKKSTVITETGNITSTGWGGSSVALVLKESDTDANGICSAVFYVFSFGMGEFHESTKSDLLNERFENYSKPNLVKIVFEEKTDENGKMYLLYHMVKPEDYK